MRFVVIKKFKMSFKVVWHTVCGCSGWFGVVICGLGTIAYCRTITFFPVQIMQLGAFIGVLTLAW